MNEIYVACLASYNNGILYGQWIEIEDKTKEEIQEEIDLILKQSPEPFAEEYAIHDYNGPISSLASELGEWPDFDELIRIVEFIGNSEDRVKWLASDYSTHIAVDNLEDAFTESFYGTFSSEEEFAREYYEEKGYGGFTLIDYVDWKRVWEGEFDCNGWNAISLSNYQVAIFSS
jgi:antirestriction protein